MMRVGFQQHHRLKARSVHSNLCRFPVSPCMRTVLCRLNFFAKILSVERIPYFWQTDAKAGKISRKKHKKMPPYRQNERGNVL